MRNKFLTQNISDLKKYRQYVRQHCVSAKVELFKKPSPVRGLYSILVNYFFIFIALVASSVFLWTLPIAVLLVANRQMALNNLLHDCAHGNLFTSNKIGDRVGSTLIAAPLLTSVRQYRVQHVDHHKYLGLAEKDYDYIVSKGTWYRTFFSLVFDFDRWKGALQSDLKKLSSGEILNVAVWWLLFVFLLYLYSVNAMIIGILIWWASRATVGYLLDSFALMIDHYGLEVGPPSIYTRNVVGHPVIKHILQPMDGLHLVHHLFPDIPYYNTFSVHELLLELPEYQELCHCDGYFFGELSVMRTWVERT